MTLTLGAPASGASPVDAVQNLPAASSSGVASAPPHTVAALGAGDASAAPVKGDAVKISPLDVVELLTASPPGSLRQAIAAYVAHAEGASPTGAGASEDGPPETLVLEGAAWVALPPTTAGETGLP